MPLQPQLRPGPPWSLAWPSSSMLSTSQSMLGTPPPTPRMGHGMCTMPSSMRDSSHRRRHMRQKLCAGLSQPDSDARRSSSTLPRQISQKKVSRTSSAASRSSSCCDRLRASVYIGAGSSRRACVRSSALRRDSAMPSGTLVIALAERTRKLCALSTKTRRGDDGASSSAASAAITNTPRWCWRCSRVELGLDMAGLAGARAARAPAASRVLSLSLS
mmetsp:Transcript_22023/g.67625  ORF Transcript_22023/g.67625 Transcript_22023/m.67625 type:complete len:217 (+) Transcript_22023:1615-2265(+)